MHEDFIQGIQESVEGPGADGTRLSELDPSKRKADGVPGDQKERVKREGVLDGRDVVSTENYIAKLDKDEYLTQKIHEYECRSFESETMIQKRVKREFREDQELILQLHVAEKLGMTLTDLRHKMPTEELWLWSLFYEWRAEQEQKALNKGRAGRR